MKNFIRTFYILLLVLNLIPFNQKCESQIPDNDPIEEEEPVNSSDYRPKENSKNPEYFQKKFRSKTQKALRIGYLRNQKRTMEESSPMNSAYQAIHNCKLHSMIGNKDNGLCIIVDNLKQISEDIKSNKGFDKYADFKNALFLFGPPGNGKTRIARSIALMAKCSFISISASNITGYRYGEGVDTIKALKIHILEEHNKTKKPVVVLIDEFDRIGLNFKSEAREQEQNALVELWKLIDEMDGKPCVFFIFATNKKEKDFDPRLVSRIKEKLTISNPSDSERTELLQVYLQKHNLNVTQHFLTELTAKTNDLSFRDLKTLVANIESFLIKHPDAPFNRELVLQLLIEMKSKKLELETKAEEIENEDERRRQIMEEQHEMQRGSLLLQGASVVLQAISVWRW